MIHTTRICKYALCVQFLQWYLLPRVGTKEAILNVVHTDSGISTREAVRAFGGYKWTVWTFLDQNKLHALHLNTVQASNETGYVLIVQFPCLLFNSYMEQYAFIKTILWTDGHYLVEKEFLIVTI